MPDRKFSEKIVIIGAGFTGLAAAYDLAQRGFQVSVIERGELVSGTSGRTHGLLHSGARYCVHDPESARECIAENTILRRIAVQCIEQNGGYFLALNDEDLTYAEQFLEGSVACGIPTQPVQISELLQREPGVNPGVRLAFQVPDATFDPLRLGFAFAASARKQGARFFPYHEVEEVILDGTGQVSAVQAWDRTTGERTQVPADLVLNAGGAWAGRIAGMAGLTLPVKPTPGIMVAVEKRLTHSVLNRLCPPGDGDIILPQRRMVVIGTTSFEGQDVDYIPIFRDQVEQMVEQGSELLPAIRSTPFRGIYMSSRPLVASGIEARSLARTFKVYDHGSQGVAGLISIIGGKATTCRLMAEKTADMICDKVGRQAECRSASETLESYRSFYRQEG